MPKPWAEEMQWITQRSKGRPVRASILKLALAEAIYGIWQFRNNVNFGKITDNNNIVFEIVDKIVYKGWVEGVKNT